MSSPQSLFPILHVLPSIGPGFLRLQGAEIHTIAPMSVNYSQPKKHAVKTRTMLRLVPCAIPPLWRTRSESLLEIASKSRTGFNQVGNRTRTQAPLTVHVNSRFSLIFQVTGLIRSRARVVCPTSASFLGALWGLCHPIFASCFINTGAGGVASNRS
jgi:hypothetical protein